MVTERMIVGKAAQMSTPCQVTIASRAPTRIGAIVSPRFPEERWRERERESAERHEEQMLEMQLARTALKERIAHLNRLILSSKSLMSYHKNFSISDRKHVLIS